MNGCRKCVIINTDVEQISRVTNSHVAKLMADCMTDFILEPMTY